MAKVTIRNKESATNELAFQIKNRYKYRKKNEVDKFIDDCVLYGKKPGVKTISEAADLFIRCLQDEIEDSSIGASAIGDIIWLSKGSPRKVGNGRYTVNVKHDGFMYRSSLINPEYGPTGGGVEDIVKLLNYGYSASKPVWGYWIGYGFTRSLQEREGAGFIESAIATFKVLGGEYGVVDVRVN